MTNEGLEIARGTNFKLFQGWMNRWGNKRKWKIITKRK